MKSLPWELHDNTYFFASWDGYSLFLIKLWVDGLSILRFFLQSWSDGYQHDINISHLPSSHPEGTVGLWQLPNVMWRRPLTSGSRRWQLRMKSSVMELTRGMESRQFKYSHYSLSCNQLLQCFWNIVIHMAVPLNFSLKLEESIETYERLGGTHFAGPPRHADWPWWMRDVKKQ